MSSIHFAYNRHNFENKPKTFIHFCWCLEELWSWISQPSSELSSEYFLWHHCGNRFNIFHFWCIKFVVKWNRTRNWKSWWFFFFFKKNCSISRQSQFKYIREKTSPFLRSPDSFILAFYRSFYLFIFCSHYNECSSPQANTWQLTLFQSDLQPELYSTQFIQHS